MMGQALHAFTTDLTAGDHRQGVSLFSVPIGHGAELKIKPNGNSRLEPEAHAFSSGLDSDCPVK
jgi:hypothetical protein